MTPPVRFADPLSPWLLAGPAPQSPVRFVDPLLPWRRETG